MKSKAGNTRKKIRKLALAAGLALTGCITEPEHRVIHEQYTVDPSCLHEDSTTWTDTTEVHHLSCTINPSGHP